MGLHSNAFENRFGSSTNFYAQSASPANNSNLEQPVEGIYADDGPNQGWCSGSWVDQQLGSAGDKGGLDWGKPAGNIDSLFPQPSFDRTWRCRTSSDSGGLSPSSKRAPVCSCPSLISSYCTRYK